MGEEFIPTILTIQICRRRSEEIHHEGTLHFFSLTASQLQFRSHSTFILALFNHQRWAVSRHSDLKITGTCFNFLNSVSEFTVTFKSESSTVNIDLINGAIIKKKN